MAMVLEGGEAFVREQNRGRKTAGGALALDSSPSLLSLSLQKVNPDPSTPSTSLLFASLASSLQGEWSCLRGLASV